MNDAARDLTGCVALVTGAARRLGRHLASALAERGAEVAVHYNSSADEAALLVQEIESRGGRCSSFAADLSERGAARQLIRDVGGKFGRLDIIINNVGNYLVKPIEENTEDEWADTFQTNLIAPLGIINASLPLFPPSGGWIINLGYAGLEHLTSNVFSTAYQISKTGLYLLTRSFAQRLARRGIRVNMISPGHLDNSVDLPRDVSTAIPLGRAGRPEDIADAMFFLLRRDSYVTGVNIDVSGGYRMGLSEKFSALDQIR